MRDIHVSAIADAVKKLCMEANVSLEPDVLRAFDRALGTERSPAGRQVLQILKDNAELARTKRIPYCQDTGYTVIFLELSYSLFLQWAFLTSLTHIVTRRGKGWNEVPRPVVAAAALAVPLVASLGTQWNPISAETMQSSWVEGLAIFVGVNTLVYAVLSVFQMLPPIMKTIHDGQARRRRSRSA